MARGRQRPLTQEEKDYMQKRRAEARREKEEAIAALNGNPQFTKPTFWRSVDAETVQAVQSAIRDGLKQVKKREIKKLERRINKLREDM